MEVAAGSKVNSKSTKPCDTYIELTFTKLAEIALFSYLSFQNFYTHSITIKQFIPPSSANAASTREQMKNDDNWVTILKNYRLMKNAHYENDDVH